MAALAVFWPRSVEAQPQPSGDQFQVNTLTASAQRDPDVGMDSSGNFVVVWESYRSTGADTDGAILAQRYASDGSPVGTEFIVNSYTTNRQNDPRVSMNASGEFVVVWENVYGPDYPGEGVRARRFAADGSAVGSDFRVSLTDETIRPVPNVDVRDDGSFVITWLNLNFSDVLAKRYDSNGVQLGSTIRIDAGTFDPVGVAALPGGQTLLFWQTFSAAIRDLSFRLYSGAGDAIGDDFVVTDDSADAQPALAVDGDGDFLTAWTAFSGSVNGDGDGGAVRAQRFSSDGQPVAGSSLVNSYTTGSQGEPSVTLLENGDAFIVWE
ncbi:MAG: hypothetical protein AAFX50_26935, partial [Acidobacteriota bacterium]